MCRGGPARQQLQSVIFRAAGLRAVHHQGQPVLARQGHYLVVKRYLADDGMVQALRAVAEDVHVLSTPQDAEGVTAGGELTDQIRELAVIGVAAGLDPRLMCDVINAGSGTEQITVGHGKNLITAGTGTDSITVGNGDNKIFGDSGGSTITVGIGQNIIVGGAGMSSSASTAKNMSDAVPHFMLIQLITPLSSGSELSIRNPSICV